MSVYYSCPRCGRTCKETFTSCYFPLFKCNKCGTYHCNECAPDHVCPKCGATTYQKVGEVYEKK